MYKHCDFWEIGEFYDDVLGGVAKNASEAVAVGRVCLRVVGHRGRASSKFASWNLSVNLKCFYYVV